jgi:hypothetical protein
MRLHKPGRARGIVPGRDHDDLARWILGLPWVIERHDLAPVPGLRWFAVDCDVLGVHRVWALLGRLTLEPGAPHGPHVVVPDPLAARAIWRGDGSVEAAVGDSHALVTLSPRSGPRSRTQLEDALLAAYSATFG